MLGNTLYPLIVESVGDGLAAKVTGMMLEMPAAELLKLLSDMDALDSAAHRAVDALPSDVVNALTGASISIALQDTPPGLITSVLEPPAFPPHQPSSPVFPTKSWLHLPASLGGASTYLPSGARV